MVEKTNIFASIYFRQRFGECACICLLFFPDSFGQRVRVCTDFKPRVYCTAVVPMVCISIVKLIATGILTVKANQPAGILRRGLMRKYLFLWLFRWWKITQNSYTRGAANVRFSNKSDINLAVCQKWCITKKANWNAKCAWETCSGCPQCFGKWCLWGLFDQLNGHRRLECNYQIEIGFSGCNHL